MVDLAKTVHTIHGHHQHVGWDRDLSPVMTVAPGSMLTFECQEASGGQLSRDSTVDDVVGIDADRVNPVSGPIAIDGAAPGDVLKVTLLDFQPSGWGWTANIPGFGLLADQFPEPALHHWTYHADTLAPALYGPGGTVPLKPFAGTIGLAPDLLGRQSAIPPRRVGGNMDARDIAAGCELLLPVEVAGALFSIGDTHAAQGDGEVCGTAIESSMRVTLKLDLIKQTPLPAPQLTTPGPVSGHLDCEGYWVTMGIGPDLFQAAREAVMAMIDRLGAEEGMAAIDAYLLASVCGDLRISEIVDRPNWVVSFYFPRVVFT